MELNLSEEAMQKVMQTAEESKKSEVTLTTHSAQEAFLLLIKGVQYEDLSNLCKILKENLSENIDLSIEECYELTQGKPIEGKIELDDKIKKIIYTSAYQCIENGKTLGDKTIMDGKINTSEWIGHCLWEGKLAGELAQKLGLNVNHAQVLGILHDYGRKQSHAFDHVTIGYEALIKEGWETEAISSLTHSFLLGGRCSNNEPAEEGFYVDKEGNSHWREGTKKDDVTKFLEMYQYNEYDVILNIADLMATGHGIVSPSDRIADIATRRKEFDPANRSFFLAEFTNALINMLKKMGKNVPSDMSKEVKASEGVSLEAITEEFEKASELFFDEYIRKNGLMDVTDAAENPKFNISIMKTLEGQAPIEEKPIENNQK